MQESKQQVTKVVSLVKQMVENLSGVSSLIKYDITIKYVKH